MWFFNAPFVGDYKYIFGGQIAWLCCGIFRIIIGLLWCSQIVLGTSITLSGPATAVCNCSSDILQYSPGNIHWTIMVPSCPTLANKESKKILDSVEHWKCPADFTLQGGDSGCSYSEAPTCRRLTGKLLQATLHTLCICVLIPAYKDFSATVSKTWSFTSIDICCWLSIQSPGLGHYTYVCKEIYIQVKKALK